jgi:uncharacterized protein
MKTGSALILFAKSPEPGQVKTRLISGVGRRHAAHIYEKLLTRTLNIAMKSEFSEIQIWVNGNLEHRYFKRLKKRHYVKLYRQQGKDLGQRMSNAIDSALRRFSSVVLIGTDCPSLTSDDLKLAKQYLLQTNVVLGPAKDGGYYLIGLKENNGHIFSGIKWGSKSVFTETCSKIEEVYEDYKLLPMRWDVDVPRDLLPYFSMKREGSVLYY